jgi:phosphate transport system substrate-binding protein
MMHTMRSTVIVGLVVVAISAGLTTTKAIAAVTEISGAGATFPYPVYAKWAEAYNKSSGVKMNYQSIGSGGGIKQITAKTVDFGASDAPLTADELNQAGLLQFPMVMGGVVPVVNLPDIKAGQLKLSATVLADIYLGKVEKWNDSAITSLNPGLPLPNKSITVVHRSDGSGTTWIYTNYLSKVSPEWKSRVGNDKAVAWPVGVGGKGNEGVASYVSRIKGAIGYVEYAYALQNKMASVKLQNQAGKYVDPTSASFQAAAASADWSNAPGFYMVLTDQPGDTSWPITGATFILMHKKQEKPDVAKAVLGFFAWAYQNGGDMAAGLDYVPMPNSVVDLVEKNWQKEIKGSDGTVVWSGK